MFFGAVLGGAAGWELVRVTSDGRLAHFIADTRTAWVYAFAVGATLLLSAAVWPRLVKGFALCASAAAMVCAFTKVAPAGDYVFVSQFLTFATLATAAMLLASTRAVSLLPMRRRARRS